MIIVKRTARPGTPVVACSAGVPSNRPMPMRMVARQRLWNESRRAPRSKRLSTATASRDDDGASTGA